MWNKRFNIVIDCLLPLYLVRKPFAPCTCCQSTISSLLSLFPDRFFSNTRYIHISLVVQILSNIFRGSFFLVEVLDSDLQYQGHDGIRAYILYGCVWPQPKAVMNSDCGKEILYVIRKLATLGSWPLIFCSCLCCTKYQKHYIIGKLENRSIE